MKYLSDWYNKALSIIPPKYYILEEKLSQVHEANTKIMLITRSYKSFRYNQSLPLRGQRTKTNAKTNKYLKEKRLIQDKIEMRGAVVEVYQKLLWKNNVKRLYVKKGKKKSESKINI